MADDMDPAAVERAAREFPYEHVGYPQPVSEGCSCDECYTTDVRRDAFERGYRAALAAASAGEAEPSATLLRLADEMEQAEWPGTGDERRAVVEAIAGTLRDEAAAQRGGEAERMSETASSGLMVSYGFTPTTGQVRNRYAAGRRVLDARDACLTPVGELDAEFDRWLAAQRGGEAVDRGALILLLSQAGVARAAALADAVLDLLAARGDAPADGVWTCGHCGRSSEAHGLPDGPSYGCVYEPVWRPVAPVRSVSEAQVREAWEASGHLEVPDPNGPQYGTVRIPFNPYAHMVRTIEHLGIEVTP